MVKSLMILETVVQDDKVMQDFELESAPMEVEHSQKVKTTSIGSDYGSKNCVNLSSLTAVFRMILCLCFPLILCGVEFTASVNRTEVDFGESIALSLTLKEGNAKETPSLEPLRKSFSIRSQQQLFNTVVNQGKVSTTTTWKISLLPLKEGDLMIPSLSLETSQGTVSTLPITIQVIRGTKREDTHPPLMLTATVSNASPYKNEPITYTLKLASKSDFTDIKIDKLILEGAVIEMKGEPKIYKKVVDGLQLAILEVDYLITPLRAGELKVPSTTVQGMIPVKREEDDPFSDLRLNPFSFMRGFDQLKPFSLLAEEITIDVQPAVPGIVPWLPLRHLSLEEIYSDNAPLQEGEPFTIEYKIKAEGIKGNQLPSLNEQLSALDFLKVYADTPEFEERDGISYRVERYTLIPQRGGRLTIPSLSIGWWDLVKREKRVSSIPERVLEITPLFSSQSEVTDRIAAVESQVETIPPLPEENGTVTRSPPFFLYGMIAALGTLLILAFGWITVLQGKIKRKKSPKKERLPDLNPT